MWPNALGTFAVRFLQQISQQQNHLQRSRKMVLKLVSKSYTFFFCYNYLESWIPANLLLLVTLVNKKFSGSCVSLDVFMCPPSSATFLLRTPSCGR